MSVNYKGNYVIDIMCETFYDTGTWAECGYAECRSAAQQTHLYCSTPAVSLAREY